MNNPGNNPRQKQTNSWKRLGIAVDITSASVTLLLYRSILKTKTIYRQHAYSNMSAGQKNIAE
jgi:hypothetical protein